MVRQAQSQSVFKETPLSSFSKIYRQLLDSRKKMPQPKKADRHYTDAVWIYDEIHNIPGFYFRVFLLLEGPIFTLKSDKFIPRKL